MVGVGSVLGVGGSLVHAYRDLIALEAAMAERLAPEGPFLRTSVVDQWPILEGYLGGHAREVSLAGVLVLGGAPDEGSRWTGIPFTGPLEANAHLGIAVEPLGGSPSGGPFWSAVTDACALAGDVPLEALFDTVHLAHAVPFDFKDVSADVIHTSGAHVARLLRELRPQIVVAVGSTAVEVFGHATQATQVVELAHSPEESWVARWSPAAPMSSYPHVDVAESPPFRTRLIPIPALAGPHAKAAAGTLRAVLTNILA